MKVARTDIPASIAASPLPLLLALMMAVMAGMVTAVAGNLAGYRAIYYAAIFGLIACGGVLALTRKEPLRFIFLALIASFPIANAAVPPGRLGLAVFDVVMFALAVVLVGRRLFAAPTAEGSLFPTRSLLIAWLLFLPCVVFSLYPVKSLEVAVTNFAVYAFFLYALRELGTENGFERLVRIWAIVLIVLAAGLFIDHFLHVNLSLRGSNLNQSTNLGGMEIWRAGGFFQDPQKAGAFLSCTITFLLLLAIRGRFADPRTRLLIWTAVLCGLSALITTISRGAILACLFVSATALFTFNRWQGPAKLLAALAVMLGAAVVVLTPLPFWLDLLPAPVAERFAYLREELDIRLMIWFDTWDMFAEHPLTGIGPGAFQPYLIDTRPGMINYYGIGLEEGVTYVPDQPESGYLTILYEGGISACAAALVLAGAALGRAVAVIAGSPRDSDARTEAIAALAGLASFGATFVTLFTVTDPRLAGVLMFLLAVIWHRSLQRAGQAKRVGRRAMV